MAHFLGLMNDFSADRRLRIMHSRMEVHSVLWLVLLIGAVPTVAYPLLFSNKHAWVQVLIMGCIMLIVMSGLMVILSLQHPFSGEVSIQPEAFRLLLTHSISAR
jgi:undecaprenyl pyrophosphate phosphatase UppP